MASVDVKEIPEIKKFMEDFWKVVKEFWFPEESEEYWQAVVMQIDELVKKYPGTFCWRMCLAFVEHLEKESQEMRKRKDVRIL